MKKTEKAKTDKVLFALAESCGKLAVAAVRAGIVLLGIGLTAELIRDGKNRRELKKLNNK